MNSGRHHAFYYIQIQLINLKFNLNICHVKNYKSPEARFSEAL